MKSLRLLLLLSTCLIAMPTLSGCSKPAEPPAAPAAPAAPASAAATPSAPAAAPSAPAATPAPAPAAAAAEPAAPAAPAGAPVAGTDYVVIPDGQPFERVAGKIEVVEYFNYVCPACAAFNPAFQAWKKAQPADVRVVYLAADFRPDFVPYARSFFAGESLGLTDKAHDAVYAAIHDLHRLPAEGVPPDEAAVAAFYAQYGVGSEMFLGAMRSFAVDSKIRAARAFAVNSKVTGTPALIIDGKYLVKGNSWEDKLRIADYLIAQQRNAR